MLGRLEWAAADSRPDLLADPVRAVVRPGDGVLVAPIDPELADTAAFCERYQVPLEASTNCVIVAGKRGGVTSYAACLVLATDRADINGAIRRHLGARKVSFAPMDTATELTGMEYGGITPLGLPSSWPVLVDQAVASAPAAVIGSGLRRSKLLLPGSALTTLAAATVLSLAMSS